MALLGGPVPLFKTWHSLVKHLIEAGLCFSYIRRSVLSLPSVGTKEPLPHYGKYKICTQLLSDSVTAGWTHFWLQARNMVFWSRGWGFKGWDQPGGTREGLEETRRSGGEKEKVSMCGVMFVGTLPCGTELTQIKKTNTWADGAGWNADHASTWHGGR